MKTCIDCNQNKTLEEFYPHKDGLYGRSPYCAECSRIKARKYYKKNNNKRREQIYNARVKRKLEVFNELLNKYLIGCIDCGETNFFVLDWDHKDTENKLLPLSKMWNFSKEKIMQEVDKCELRCANCHRKKTAEQLNWRNWILEVQNGY